MTKSFDKIAVVIEVALFIILLIVSFFVVSQRYGANIKNYISKQKINISYKLLSEKDKTKKFNLYLFSGEGCSYCAKEKEFLKSLKTKYPGMEVQEYETFNNIENGKILADIQKKRNIQPEGVPVTFINDKYFVGFTEQFGVEMEAAIIAGIKNGFSDTVGEDINSWKAEASKSGSNDANNNQKEGKTPLVFPDKTLSKEEKSKKFNFYLFYGEGCSHCEDEKEFLKELKIKYPEMEVQEFEIYKNKENRDMLTNIQGKRGIEIAGVPISFVNDKFFSGFTEQRASEIEAAITDGLKNGFSDTVGEDINSWKTGTVKSSNDSISKDQKGKLVLPDKKKIAIP